MNRQGHQLLKLRWQSQKIKTFTITEKISFSSWSYRDSETLTLRSYSGENYSWLFIFLNSSTKIFLSFINGHTCSCSTIASSWSASKLGSVSFFIDSAASVSTRATWSVSGNFTAVDFAALDSLAGSVKTTNSLTICCRVSSWLRKFSWLDMFYKICFCIITSFIGRPRRNLNLRKWFVLTLGLSATNSSASRKACTASTSLLAHCSSCIRIVGLCCSKDNNWQKNKASMGQLLVINIILCVGTE